MTNDHLSNCNSLGLQQVDILISKNQVLQVLYHVTIAMIIIYSTYSDTIWVVVFEG